MNKFTGKDLKDWFDNIGKETPEQVAATINREITGVFDWRTLKWYPNLSKIPAKKPREHKNYRKIKVSKR